jgi:8-oxo-dGTP pyrophosphatase MutT (NUDIX family)
MRENSSGIIVFRRVLGQRLYLLLHYHYRGDYWDFPRGNIREDETPKEAAIRETEEETGLLAKQLRIVEGFEEQARWFYRLEGQTVHKKVTYFLAETENENVKISEEHIGAKWLIYEDALNLLKYRNSKKLLQKAEKYLRKLESKGNVKEN